MSKPPTRCRRTNGRRRNGVPPVYKNNRMSNTRSAFLTLYTALGTITPLNKPGQWLTSLILGRTDRGGGNLRKRRWLGGGGFTAQRKFSTISRFERSFGTFGINLRGPILPTPLSSRCGSLPALGGVHDCTASRKGCPCEGHPAPKTQKTTVNLDRDRKKQPVPTFHLPH